MANEKSVMAVIRAARPTFKNKADKVVFAVHASFLAAGYSLTATGPPAFSDSALYSSSTEEVGIENWNDSENEYAFVYVNTEKAVKKKVLVKFLVINDQVFLDALADGAPQPVHLEINIGEFVEANAGTSVADQFKNLDKLVKSVDAEVLSKLDGSSSASSSSSKSMSSSRQSGLGTSDRSRSGMTGVHDEPMGPHILPPGVHVFVVPPVSPNPASDIFPGLGAGMYPTRGDFGGDGSMLLGPNDPRWFGGFPNFPGGRLGGPPGARFDPYGPPGVPGFGPGRFVRNPRRPGRGTHPDV